MSGTTIASLADLPRWVGWRNEPRADDPIKLTKIPYQLDGQKAAANNPRTWTTRAKAESAVPKIVNGHGGGIGIVLGDLSNGYMLTGIDLDTCIHSDGSFEPWAEVILKRFATYSEISPSGNGAKLFFLVQHSDFNAIEPLLNNSKTGRQFKKSGAGDHPPGFEIYFKNRYFAVTDELLEGCPDTLATIGHDDLRWLLSEAGPALTRKDTDTKAGKSRSDNSRSAAAFRIGSQMRRAGASCADFCNAVRDSPETAGWYSEKGTADDGRELYRIWEKAARNGEGWRAKLILNEANKPLAILANAITAFRHAPEWKNMLAYDAFHLRTTIRRKSPWPELPGDEWTSVHDIRAAEWLQHQDIFVGPEIAGQAIEAVAREGRFHPVLEYLNHCVWDGQPRLDLWVVDYLGSADTPYNRAVGARWMISAVARVHEPGCKVDSALVLEGDQNIGNRPP